MSKPHRFEIVLGDACWVAAEREAVRLGIDIPQLVERAMCAWLTESADTASLTGVDEASAVNAN